MTAGQAAATAAAVSWQVEPENTMTAQDPHSAGAGNAKRPASADADPARPAPIAVSPALGPLPAIYVPRAGEAGGPGMLRHAATRALRRAGRRALCRLPRHHAGNPGE